MDKQSFIKTFVSNIVSSINDTVNQFAYNRLQETGRFDADEAYYKMQEYGTTLDEYVSNKFFGQLFNRKPNFKGHINF